ncbi:MAG: hypothetical protein FJ095_06490 [Deltaproteobacteria bacterium]|nr:hypothetical protein [Deltaproteobacteria bacterium]
MAAHAPPPSTETDDEDAATARGFGDALHELVNTLRFGARARLGVRRGPPALADEPKDTLFDYLDAAGARRADARERELRGRYELERLRTASTRLDYRENLYVLEALERALEGGRAPRRADGPLRVVDVGSKNFAYAFALERYFRRASGGPPKLLGVEVDGHVVYRDWRARCDYAEAYARQTGNEQVRYRVADFCALEAAEPFDVVTMFFPFVTRHALVRWGLPARFFAPARLFAKAAALCPSGPVVIASHTEEERDEAVRLARKVGLEVEVTRPLRSPLVHYHALADDRFVTRLVSR